MTADPLLEPLRELLTGLGYELVDLRRGGTRQRPVLRVRLDLATDSGEQGVSADDCARASRAIERWLEGPGGIGDRYVLEVSSPGIERPVVFAPHWRRYVGRSVRFRSQRVPGRPVATVVGVPDDASVALRLDDGREMTIPLAEIRDATLVVDWTTLGKRRE
jgi:ribosome maturation factor RimP